MSANSCFTKGIVLAGGSGTRLHPATKAISKQLLPVYDKPMVYYPLSVLISAGINEILLISTPEDVALFQRLLGDGKELGLRIQHAVQPRPDGIARAFQIGRDFVGQDNVALILGDNIFYGGAFEGMSLEAAKRSRGATIFAKPMTDPRRYGVVTLDPTGRPLAIVEKPTNTKSHLAVTGLYFYDNQVLDIVDRLRPSARNELEITEVNQAYLERSQLHVVCMDAESTWFDAGTHESYLAASVFVEMVQTERRIQIGCLEEAAFRRRLITANQLLVLSQHSGNNYGTYLRGLAVDALYGTPKH